MNLKINEQLTIPGAYLQVSFSRSSGPGGQNVNKVNSRVQLRFDVRNCPTLSEPVKKRLAHLAGHGMTQDGILLIDADEFRQQGQNRQECYMRLTGLIRQALIVPKKRRPTRRTRSSIEKRIDTKKHRGRIKSLRKGPKLDE